MNKVPLLLIVVALYNLFAFWDGGAFLSNPLIDIQLTSGATWVFSGADLLLTLGMILLYVEILKATRTSTASIFDHLLSMMLFIVTLLEFILVPEVGQSAFFLILLMVLLDVVAGFTVTISGARRDFGVDREI